MADSDTMCIFAIATNYQNDGVMATMTIHVQNSNVLESLKQVLSNMVGVEILSVNNTTDNQDETEYISSSPAMMRILEQGDKEIAEGKGQRIMMDDLWK